MGCGSSAVAPAKRFRVRELQGQDAAAAVEFTRMRLSVGDVDGLFGAFSGMDQAGVGKADLESFYRFFGFARTAFADRVFSTFDINGDGFVDFRDFVCATVDFCGQDRKALARFAFVMFDSDASGTMNRSELTEMVTEMYGPRWSLNENVRGLVAGACGLDEGEEVPMTFASFEELNVRFPVLLMPVFAMQTRVREMVLGTAYWERMYAEKLAAGPGYNVFDILQAVAADRARQLAEDAQSAKKQERYVSPHGGGYVPEVSFNPRLKAQRRRLQVEMDDAVAKGDKKRVGELKADIKALDAEAEQELEEFEASVGGMKVAEKTALAPGTAARKGAARRASAVSAAAVRRNSALGVGSGFAADSKNRRRNSVANTADRAAALAMAQ
jgi:Ca2+-binding EF-hand superfamily protein